MKKTSSSILNTVLKRYFPILFSTLLVIPVSLKGQTKDSRNYSDEVFKIVEEMPRFPGCENVGKSIDEKFECSKEKMMQYVFSNLKYPEAAAKAGVEGTVVAQFIVNKKGRLEDISIIRDIGSNCGDAVIEVLNSMNSMEERWTAGRQRGIPVKVQYAIPVKFKLDVSEDSKAAVPPPPPPKDGFIVVEQMPRFPGCDDMKGTHSEKENCAKQKMLEYLYTHLKYPEKAKTKQIEGTVVLQFVVETNGHLGDIKIVREIGGGCGEAAKAVFEQMNSEGLKWTPGIQRGKAVKVLYTMPVKFKL
ncbi:MAG: energy transducer TonB [Saprospiraceae bacterium]|nr:energy transducer TonB [Saprospiraceae bacterium]